LIGVLLKIIENPLRRYLPPDYIYSTARWEKYRYTVFF